MKVLFLDHDGVICLSSNWGGRQRKRARMGHWTTPERELPLECRFDDFDVKSVKVLNEIIEVTGVEIVVSSDWKRWATVEEMGEYYETHGIIKKPIGYTKKIDECTCVDRDKFSWSSKWLLEQERSFEINQYLIDHPEITHWVAVDDLNMSIPEPHESWGEMEIDWGLKNFVLTPRSKEGIKQSGIKEKIIKFLTDEQE